MAKNAAASATASSIFQRAHFFADAASPSPVAQLKRAIPDNIWAARAMMFLHTFALPFAFWFRPVCVFLALFWLTYRAYQVLTKPLDELANILGFDIPTTPIIDLANIKADGAIVHWSLPEKPRSKSTLKYEVHLNGSVIESGIPISESAVTITGLQPSSFYVVRVGLVNSQDFGSKSKPIRFRTKSAASGDFFVVTDGHETENDSMQELPVARAKPYRGLKDVTPASPDTAAPPMLRESSSGLGRHRSVTGGRRPSPAALGLEDKHDPQGQDEPPEGVETIQQLTERLDAIRRETDETERAAKDEEEEESRQKEDLIRERDELKAEAMEKDKASRNMKKEVNVLERQNTAAQNEKNKHERLLAQKKQERQKLKDDAVRWEREAGQLRLEAEQIQQQKVDYAQSVAAEKVALKQKHAEEAAALQALENEIKEKTAEIKKIERSAKNNSPNGAEQDNGQSLVQQMQQDAEEDRAWNTRRHEMQMAYAAAFQGLERAKSFHANQVRFLESMRADRRRAEEQAAAYASPPATVERATGIRRGDSQRSRRGTSGPSISTNDSPRLTSFPPASVGHAAFSSQSGFPTAPFLNISNGMTVGRPTAEEIMGLSGLSEEEKDKLTGGAPMSPGAGAELLPTDLFGDNDGLERAQSIKPLPGLGALPGLGGLPGLAGATGLGSGMGAMSARREEHSHSDPAAHPGPGPASPVSTSSKSQSAFASPQASQNNLHLGSPENTLDDRRSVRSTRSNRATSGGAGAMGSRFSGMFGIKQRTKTMSADEGPALGKAQSHSMPRQDQGLAGVDSASRKRNSSISGAVFGGMLSKADKDGASDALVEQPSPADAGVRRRPFSLNPFSKDKADGWPSTFTAFGRRPASPRPGSTHSTELPRPSMDSSRWGVDTWPSNDAASGARNSPLSYGGWNAPVVPQSRLFGSRHPSRRPSVQHGASGPPEDIMEDDDSDALSAGEEPHLAPIGTKPPPGSKKSTEKQPEAPKLNPNAKDFKSFFGSMRLGKEKGETSGGKTPVQSASTTPQLRSVDDDDSPPNSRKSRDARSMTTTESSIAESNRTSNDLARTPSYSNSDAAAPSPSFGSGGKETFMQKISRKSSSSKFSLPTFNRQKSKLDTSTSRDTTPTPAEDEEDAMSASVSSLKEPRESIDGPSAKVNRGSGRSWSSVLKLGKKKAGGETPSMSGLSWASDANDDTEEDEDARV